MSRFTEIIYQYDPRTVFIGHVRANGNELEYEHFNVLSEIGGIEYDITKGFSEKIILSFKETFEEHVFAKHWDDLKEKLRECEDDWEGPDAA